jgi:hypothetical protein
MKLSEEDTSQVYMKDMPEQSEYSQIIYDAQEVGKLIAGYGTTTQIQSYNNKTWSAIMNLMAGCIARGMRLQREIDNER